MTAKLVAIFLIFGFCKLGLAEEKKLERYYVGIGVDCTHHGLISGRVAGDSIKIFDVLRNGPAELAGLKQDDEILEIEKKKVKGEGYQWLLKMLGDGKEGSIVNLKIGRQKPQGGTEEFVVQVKRTKIDRAERMLKLGSLKSTLQTGDVGVKFTSTISEDKQNKKFIYKYIVENTGKVPILVNWGAIDSVIVGFKDKSSFKNMIYLKQGETKEVVMESSDWPWQLLSEVSVNQKIPTTFLKQLPNNRGDQIKLDENTFWLFMAGGQATAFVPEYWVNKHY